MALKILESKKRRKDLTKGIQLALYKALVWSMSLLKDSRVFAPWMLSRVLNELVFLLNFVYALPHLSWYKLVAQRNALEN